MFIYKINRLKVLKKFIFQSPGQYSTKKNPQLDAH